MSKATRNIFAVALLLAALAASGEAPYTFRGRLAAIHRADRRDMSLKAGADEFEFRNGAQLFVPADAPGLVRRAAEDFADYLVVSMVVNASVRAEGAEPRPGLQPGVTVAISNLGRSGYDVDVGADGVKISASDAWMAAQAFYHLEDAMNLRRGPFLKLGKERRSPVFAHRFTFAGFGDDIFPDAHLAQIAHHGFSGLEVWLDDYDVPSQGVRQDVNDLIDRAAKFGLEVKLSPRNHAFVHPDDPKAREAYDAAYGRLARYYPKAGGIGFCGEVCEFPSKDPRANGRSYRDKSPKAPGDNRPNPGWFPCSDWADWTRMVKDIVRGYNPGCRFIFSTYNWGNKDEKARADLIASLPKDITLIPTFEMFESHVKRNGLVSPVADYSLAFPGPGRYFQTEAAQAKAAGIELWSNCNSAGLTWDFGNIPYQPAPWQWKKRWDALKDAHAKWNLTGLRENHEYGWYPSFIAELEKECMTDGGMDFDAHVRAVAARDFGEANADAAVEAWRRWSRAAADYVPTDENQYGPCRIGPAYPFNFFGEDLQKGWKPPADFPLEPGAKFTICHFDFAKPIWGLGMAAVVLDETKERQEIELFESQVADYGAGAEAFRRIAASLPEGRRDEAVRMAALGEYLKCTCQTVVHLKRGRIAWRNGDRKAVEKLARAEYANAASALKAVDVDSRLGWLASSGYTGGRAQIEWKLRKMRELYGDSVSAAAAGREPNISVFASAIHKTAKQRGVSIAQAADMLYAAGVRGFDTSASDANLPALAATKLKPINLYCFPNMYAEDNGAAECARILDTAVKYGVPRVMVVPSSFRKGGDEASDFATILSAMRIFVEKGRERGITVTVEDFGGTNNPCSYAKYLKRFLDEIPDLRFALDSGNLYYAGRGDDILDMMKYAKGRIAHVHLKDQTHEDNHKYATIGLGAVPNAEIVRTVAADGYDGWYTLENPVGDVYDDVLRQVAVLKAWAAAGRR